MTKHAQLAVEFAALQRRRPTWQRLDCSREWAVDRLSFRAHGGAAEE